MVAYQSTSKRRYLWGIAVVCALLFCAMIASDLLSDRFAVTLRFFGHDFRLQITRASNPIAFWLTVGVLGPAALTAVIVASRGLSRVQHDERKS